MWICVYVTVAQSQPNAFTSIKVNDFHFDPTQSSTCFWYVCRYVPLNKRFVLLSKQHCHCWNAENQEHTLRLIRFCSSQSNISSALCLTGRTLLVSRFLCHENDCRATGRQWNANAVAHWQRKMKHKDIGWGKRIASNALRVLRTINSKKMCSSCWCSNYSVCFVLFSL